MTRRELEQCLNTYWRAVDPQVKWEISQKHSILYEGDFQLYYYKNFGEEVYGSQRSLTVEKCLEDAVEHLKSKDDLLQLFYQFQARKPYPPVEEFESPKELAMKLIIAGYDI